jgi:hypothetical protein
MHFLYGQEKGMNCGPACVLMCVAKINKISPNQAIYYEDQVREMYNKLTGDRDSGDKNGTGPEGLVSVLNRLNCGRWSSEKVASTDASDKIMEAVGTSSVFRGPIVDVNPVIVAVDWDGGGAHWVVIDTVRTINGKNFATICDPWDANVHVEEIVSGKQFVYIARAENRIDFAGTHHEYKGANKGPVQFTSGSTTSTGRLKIWPMIARL